MNELEFKEVIATLEIPIIKIKKYQDFEKYICTWNSLNISYDTRTVAYVIKDEQKNKNVTFEIADIISKNNPDDTNNYKIYKIKENNEVYIYTKEGLLIFILELQDYYARKLGLPEIYVNQYQDLLNTISVNLIKKTETTQYTSSITLDNIEKKSSQKKHILTKIPKKD